MKFINPLLIIFSFYFINTLPTAVIHGFLEKCTSRSVVNLISYLKNTTNNYITCIESGGGMKDALTSFYTQADKACEAINSDPNFNEDFSLVSISQGGVLSRYIIEKCQTKGTVKKFISIGGPLSGTHQFPFCLKGAICHFINSLVDWFVYKDYVQDSIGPAGYFRVSNHLNDYYNSKSLLFDINNEGKFFDESAKKRFLKLDLLVLIAFEKDRMITPKESAFFAEYDENHELVDMENTRIYKEDLFGLKTLNEKGKILKFWINNRHCKYEWKDIDRTVVPFI